MWYGYNTVCNVIKSIGVHLIEILEGIVLKNLGLELGYTVDRM